MEVEIEAAVEAAVDAVAPAQTDGVVRQIMSERDNTRKTPRLVKEAAFQVNDPSDAAALFEFIAAAIRAGQPIRVVVEVGD